MDLARWVPGASCSFPLRPLPPEPAATRCSASPLLLRSAITPARKSQLRMKREDLWMWCRYECAFIQVSKYFTGCEFPAVAMVQVCGNKVTNPWMLGLSKSRAVSPYYSFDHPSYRAKGLPGSSLKCFHGNKRQKSLPIHHAIEDKTVKKMGNQEHHFWKKRDSAGSGQKALNLLRIISGLPNEKETVYGELDKWIAWEEEFPLISVAKALQILRKRSQWTQVIQLAKWMLSKGQVATMGTYDTLLLAFDMDQRVDEAESVWGMILQAHSRSISKRLFSRMISLFDNHDMPDKIIEIFADMEELGVKPDEDTARRIARAFLNRGLKEKQEMVLKRYLSKYKYVHFKGERVQVKRSGWDCE